MKIKTVSIIGLGALGILFGNHLSKRMKKEDLRIIASEDRIKRYSNIYCNDELCDFNFITPEEKNAPADLLIIAVKYSALKDAIKDIKNQVGENTIILSLLNGITSEKLIAEAYGEDKVLYSVAQGMDAVREGNKLTYKNMGMICFGEKEAGVISEKVGLVEDFFKSVELPHEVQKDMYKRLWSKFMLNVGVNQTVALYRGNYGTIQVQGEARDTMIRAMREVILLSEKEGINLTEEDLNYWLNILDGLSETGKPSMAQDMEAKRLSEVDLFSGAVLELGKKYLLETPVNKNFYDRVKAIESGY